MSFEGDEECVGCVVESCTLTPGISDIHEIQRDALTKSEQDMFRRCGMRDN